MSFTLSFATDHRLALLQFVNFRNPDTIIQPLTLENTLVADPSPEVDGKYAVELTNKSDDTDRVTVTHLKHKLENFFTLQEIDIEWYEPTMPIEELRPHALPLFQTLLMRAGIVVQKGFGDPDISKVEVLQEPDGRYFLTFDPKSHVWAEMKFPLPPTLELYSKVKDLDGFNPH